MATGFFIATTVASIGAGAYAYATAGQQSLKSDMAPATLNSFSLTKTEEGSIVPRVFGRVRLTGNLLHYGNLKSKPEYQDVSGGKGGGGGSSSSLKGYHYYLDNWQAICCGPAEIVGVYKQDDPVESVEDFLNECDFNDGTTSFYPAEAGDTATCLPGTCHLWLPQFYCGFQTQNLPTLHYVVQDKLPCPVAYSDLPNGKNPAAIIYTMLMDAGAVASNIDLATFNAAATYWKNQGYGLNFAMQEQKTTEEWIEAVLSTVGGYFTESPDGTLKLRAHDPHAAASAAINDEHILSSQFNRPAWDKVSNEFVGKFVNADQDFSDGTCKADNPASKAMLGCIKSTSVDLQYFRDAEAANKRLWEIMKRESYPAATLNIDVTLEFATLERGEIVTVSLADYGVSNMDLVIENVSVDYDQGSVSLDLREVPERIFDDHYTAPGSGSQWHRPDYTPQVLTHTRIMPLPRNPITGNAPGLLVLAAREQGVEDLLSIHYSTTGTDYTRASALSAWSQAGQLTVEYPDNTYAIDDEIGITYRPYRDDPQFNTLSRSDFFATNRWLICGDEIMRFQQVQLQPDGTIKLMGIARGVFGTPVQTHFAAAQCWLTNVGDAVLSGNAAKRGYYKLVPSVGGHSVDIGDVSANHVESVDLAARPWPVSAIHAERAGSTINVRWWPRDVGLGGAGLDDEDVQLDQWPPTFTGDFVVNGVPVAACETSITSTDAINITVCARQNGNISDAVTVDVGTADGTYYA